MTDEVFASELEGLKTTYGDINVAKPSAERKLIRIHKAPLPKGCSPSSTQVLLVVQAGQPKPQVYVKPGIKVPNGADPRSTSVVGVEGEEWLQFSYAFPWDENSHTLVQFVEASLRRFAKLE
jgi:hypothetical protein